MAACTLQYYDRFPPSSESTFKLNKKVHHENPEGVMKVKLHVKAQHARRSAGSGRSSSVTSPPIIISLDKELCQQLNDIPLLDSLHISSWFQTHELMAHDLIVPEYISTSRRGWAAGNRQIGVS